MPIPLPNLDDRSYADLVEEARALIPTLYPCWTDYNPTDPGIVLVELLAWLTEMLLYRIDQVSEANYWTFLKLLNDRKTYQDLDYDDLPSATRQTVLALRERYRAVTPDDFEFLATQVWPSSPEAEAYLAKSRFCLPWTLPVLLPVVFLDEDKITLASMVEIKRVRCIPDINLEREVSVRLKPAPGHVSLVVAPDAPSSVLRPQPSDELCAALWRFFDARRLLTTRHHVVGPDYVTVEVAAKLHLDHDARPRDALPRAKAALEAFFHPLTGGPDGRGWPFGRDVHPSEVYQLLDQTPGVDYVEGVKLNNEVSCVELADHQLAAVQINEEEFVALEPWESVE